MAKRETPLLDQLEGGVGEWPSFVKDIKQAAEKNPMAQDLLRQLGLS
jgi:sulfite reductase alpha subunit